MCRFRCRKNVGKFCINYFEDKEKHFIFAKICRISLYVKERIVVEFKIITYENVRQ